MACPVALSATLATTVAGTISLVVHDRPFRILSRGVGLALVAGWVAYFALSRTPLTRTVLEVASVAALVAGTARVTWLVRRDPGSLPAIDLVRRVFEPLGRVFTTPLVLSVKVWLAAMLVMQFRGKAAFSALEYGIVGVVLAAAIGVQLHRRRPRSNFSALESLAAGTCAPECPLGFAAARRAATPEPAAATARTRTGRADAHEPGLESAVHS